MKTWVVPETILTKLLDKFGHAQVSLARTFSDGHKIWPSLQTHWLEECVFKNILICNIYLFQKTITKESLHSCLQYWFHLFKWPAYSLSLLLPFKISARQSFQLLHLQTEWITPHTCNYVASKSVGCDLFEHIGEGYDHIAGEGLKQFLTQFQRKTWNIFQKESTGGSISAAVSGMPVWLLGFR